MFSRDVKGLLYDTYDIILGFPGPSVPQVHGARSVSPYIWQVEPLNLISLAKLKRGERGYSRVFTSS